MTASEDERAGPSAVDAPRQTAGLGSHRRRRQHGNPFSIRGPASIIEWSAVYRRVAPLALDVGCGPGAFAVELARQHPEWNVLGLEIRPHLVASVLESAATLGLGNLHALLANANLHLSEILPDASVAFLALNFPDPWYKRRHHKRRVLSADWLRSLAPKLRVGAALHVMTDYEALALYMRAVLDATPWLVNLDGKGQFAAASTTGISSERERVHERRGESIYRLRFERAPQ